MSAGQVKRRGGGRASRGIVGSIVALTFVVLVAVAVPAGVRAAVPKEFFGVSAVRPESRDFERMGKAKVGTYRMMLAWHQVQPTRDGPYDWSLADREVGEAARNRMQPFPFFYGSPSFAAGVVQAPPLGSRIGRRGWRRFLAAAVDRYGPRGEFWKLNPSLPYRPMRAYQIWNEQNAEHFWRPRPSPRKYAKLLRMSSKAIKRADPGAEIVLGGMFGFPGGDRSIFMKGYLNQLYRVRGVRRHFDGVALHPYGGTLRLLRFQVQRARRIMELNGDRGARIWITEVGWGTDGPRKWQQVTSKKGQAKRLKRAFDLLVRKRRRWKIERVVWYVWRDFGQGDCRWCGGAGLFDRNGKPKPSWRAFRKFTGG